VLAVSSANAAMQNHVIIHEYQTRPNPALLPPPPPPPWAQTGLGRTTAIVRDSKKTRMVFHDILRERKLA
jgi:hypothetical protein